MNERKNYREWNMKKLEEWGKGPSVYMRPRVHTQVERGSGSHDPAWSLRSCDLLYIYKSTFWIYRGGKRSSPSTYKYTKNHMPEFYTERKRVFFFFFRWRDSLVFDTWFYFYFFLSFFFFLFFFVSYCLFIILPLILILIYIYVFWHFYCLLNITYSWGSTRKSECAKNVLLCFNILFFSFYRRKMKIYWCCLFYILYFIYFCT